MKRVFIFAFALLLMAGTGFAIRTYDWNIIPTTTEAQTINCPGSGIFRDIGSRTVMLLKSAAATAETYSILYYQSNGTKLLSTEGVIASTAVTLKSPYFKLACLTSAADLGARITAEVYILN